MKKKRDLFDRSYNLDNKHRHPLIKNKKSGSSHQFNLWVSGFLFAKITELRAGQLSAALISVLTT